MTGPRESKPAAFYFKSSQEGISRILFKVKELDTLNNRLKNYLEPQMADYCRVANLINGRLVILAANSAIATQLRFQTQNLLLRFKKDRMLAKIHEITLKVRPFAINEPKQLKQRVVALLKKETAAEIRKVAETLEDNALREVLLRISKRIE